MSTERRRELISQAAMEARLQQNAYDRFEDAAAEYFGLNRTAMRCLDVLDRAGQLTAGDIARETGLSSGAVTALLDRLERSGHLRRLSDPGDRRRVLVQLTDEFRAAAAEIYGPLTEAMTEFERYTDDEITLIRDFLRLGSDLLVVQAARIQELARRRAGTAAGD